MKRLLPIVIAVLFRITYCDNLNSIHFDIPGISNLACVNYERLVWSSDKSQSGFIFGIDYSYVWHSENRGLKIGGLGTIIKYVYLRGVGSNKLEANLGSMALIGFDGFFYLIPKLAIGYRYHKPNRHFLFRCGVMDYPILPVIPYVSAGFSF